MNEIQNSNLIISSCGSTIYEILYLKKNFIGFKVVNNQKNAYEYLAENNLMIPSKLSTFSKDFNKVLPKIFLNKKIHKKINNIDILGKERLSKKLINLLLK